MIPDDTAAVAQELEALERALLDPVTRHDRNAVARLLTEDFREFGSSGTVYDRAAVLDLLEHETPRSITLSEFAVSLLAPDLALATYRSTSVSTLGEAHCLRSSLWCWRHDRWLLRFHQGTRIPQ